MISAMQSGIGRRYATLRGLARLALADLEHAVGRLRPFSEIDFSRITRFVFVCQGNVCRSCFAEFVARREGLPTASFGLAAGTGARAFAKAVEAATAFGIDLEPHRVTSVDDFEVVPGDLLVTMEVRQARRLVSTVQDRSVQITLIGLWSRPFRPHLHDPYEHGMDYFDTCFRVLESGVRELAATWHAGTTNKDGGAGADGASPHRPAAPAAAETGLPVEGQR